MGSQMTAGTPRAGLRDAGPGAAALDPLRQFAVQMSRRGSTELPGCFPIPYIPSYLDQLALRHTSYPDCS